MGKSKKYHVIYRITNLINGYEYIGAHSTNNIDDNYFGSGKNLREDIKKYGKGIFSKEILSTWSSRTEMFDEEEKIVDEEFVERKNTYNQCVGGVWVKEGCTYRPKNISERKLADSTTIAPAKIYKSCTARNLIHNIMIENGEKECSGTLINDTRTQNNNELVVKYIFKLYYSYTDIVVNMETAKKDVAKAFQFLRDEYGVYPSHHIAHTNKEKFIDNLPLAYIANKKFCRWFVKNYYQKFLKGEFPAIELSRMDNDSKLYKLLENIITDQKIIIKKYPPSEYMIHGYDEGYRTVNGKRQLYSWDIIGYMKWFGENNEQEIYNRRKLRKQKRKIAAAKRKAIKPDPCRIKKVTTGSWWK